MNINIKHAVFGVIAAVFLIGFIEVALNLLALLSLRVNQLLDPNCVSSSAPCVDIKVRDKLLGHRPNPVYPGHYYKGFRNSKVPTKADIITFGDSHTYGINVDSEDAWPKQLERIYEVRHSLNRSKIRTSKQKIILKIQKQLSIIVIKRCNIATN